MIDLDPGPEVAELRERVAAFVQATVIPAEQRDHSEHGLDESLRAELQDAARAAGLFAPQMGHRPSRPARARGRQIVTVQPPTQVSRRAGDATSFEKRIDR